jgi:hypothetical protein
MEVLVAIVTGLSAVLVALVGRQGHQLKKVNYQVSNNHRSNLRDDLDRVIGGMDQIAEQQRRTTTEVIGLRSDLSAERLERVQLGERVTRVETTVHRSN